MNTTTIRWNRSQDRYKPAPLLVGSAATWGDARALVEQATRELVSSR